MKKLKQITAMIGVIVLIALYITTFVIALKGGENSGRLLAASIYATVVFPVLLWAYTFIYRLIQKHYGKDNDQPMPEPTEESEKENE